MRSEGARSHTWLVLTRTCHRSNGDGDRPRTMPCNGRAALRGLRRLSAIAQTVAGSSQRRGRPGPAWYTGCPSRGAGSGPRTLFSLSGAADSPAGAAECSRRRLDPQPPPTSARGAVALPFRLRRGDVPGELAHPPLELARPLQPLRADEWAVSAPKHPVGGPAQELLMREWVWTAMPSTAAKAAPARKTGPGPHADSGAEQRVGQGASPKRALRSRGLARRSDAPSPGRRTRLTINQGEEAMARSVGPRRPRAWRKAFLSPLTSRPGFSQPA